MYIIIKNSKPHLYGKIRSESEKNLRREWGPTMSDEQLDKLQYLEKKETEKFGKKKFFIGLDRVDEVK